jgi:hypothetical protein
MNQWDENTKHPSRAESFEELKPEVREALSDFKASVNAWSESMMSRPREVKAPVRANWNRAAKWALGCVVFAGTVSGGIYQDYRQKESARVEAARIAEQQRELAAKRAVEEEDLMARVDSDVARQVPSALEPLASLMEDSGNIGN